MDELEKLKGELPPLNQKKDREDVEAFAVQIFDFADKYVELLHFDDLVLIFSNRFHQNRPCWKC
jgi:hypothetical protein